MPRPASSLWEHFNKVMPNRRATCKYCGYNMCGLILRMRKHLARKCPSCPESIKTEMFTDLGRKPSQAKRTRPIADQPLSQSQSQTQTQTQAAASTTPLTQHVATEAPAVATVAVVDDKDDISGFIARAIFGAGLSVTTVEHSAFVKMLRRLNPTYNPPSAHVLATSVLDLEYLKVQMKLRAEVLHHEAVSIGMESWTALPKRLLVSCIVTERSSEVFGFESTGDLPQTPEVLAGKIENIMTQVEVKRVSAIVMDMTENIMRKASTTLQNKHPTITFLPSCAHTMTAMVMEILTLPAIAKTLDTCKELARFFAQDHFARSALVRASAQSQPVKMTALLGGLNDTSPSGLLDCLSTIECNRHLLDTLVAENDTLDKMNARIKEQITSIGFWDELLMLAELFEPFHELLKMFETESPLLSMFYYRFTSLWEHLHVDKYGSLASEVRQIMSKYCLSVQHPAIYTAYLLDPRFPSSSLSGKATSEALTYIKQTSSAEVYESIVNELTRFTARTGLFADDAIWESAQKCGPLHWWKGFIGGLCPNLQQVALRTLGFPATSGLSGSMREVFEKIQAIHTKDMNEEQATKAAVVYLSSNLVSSVDGAATETRV